MKYFYWPFQGGTSFVDHLCFYVSCVYHAFESVHCCLVVTCWDRADLSALFGDVYCIFVTFPWYILGQVWYLFVSFPDLCRLSYFHQNCITSHIEMRLLYIAFNSQRRWHFVLLFLIMWRGKQISGIDTIKFQTWPGTPYGKVTKYKKTQHTRALSQHVNTGMQGKDKTA